MRIRRLDNNHHHGTQMTHKWHTNGKSNLTASSLDQKIVDDDAILMMTACISGGISKYPGFDHSALLLQTRVGINLDDQKESQLNPDSFLKKRKDKSESRIKKRVHSPSTVPLPSHRTFNHPRSTPFPLPHILAPFPSHGMFDSPVLFPLPADAVLQLLSPLPHGPDALFGFLDPAADARSILFVLFVLSCKTYHSLNPDFPLHPCRGSSFVFPRPSHALSFVCAHPRHHNLVKINPLVHRLYSIRQLL